MSHFATPGNDPGALARRHAGPAPGDAAAAALLLGMQDHASQADDHHFIAMRAAFRPTGGVARGEDLAHSLAARGRGGYAELARLIASRAVLSFAWNRSHWLPMFQFDAQDLSIRPETRLVIDALDPGCDGWTLARWFARPHAGLNELAPVDLLHSDLPAVLEVANADRAGHTVGLLTPG